MSYSRRKASMSDSSSDEEYPPNKRIKASGPTSFVTWNANGLVSRCTWNKDDLVKLLHETEGPDILCLQEVRIKAIAPTNRGTPEPSDYKSIKEVMESTVFANYQKYWSLADTKYAGTLTLLHKRLQFAAEDAAFSVEAAISLLLQRYNLTRADVGIPSFPKPGPPSPPKKRQLTMHSFFQKAGEKESKNGRTAAAHQEEGRFQFLAFPGFDLINTYVPNNGTKEESFQRRREWDGQMKTFLAQRKDVLERAGAAGRPLLWMGDMNVARDYRDGTHWEKTGGANGKPSNGEEPSTYEWWKDESQCFVAGVTKKLDANRGSGDRGIPSFTANERLRFAALLDEFDLDDVWRSLHPDGIAEGGEDANKYQTQWDLPNWTWRGHLSKDGGAYLSKYEGKGQRLDYFLLSPSSLTGSIVEKCSILGYGARREGLYCGSDHCAALLKLKEAL